MSTSVSSVVSHFPSAENGFTTTLASTISSGATTVPLNSVAGYSNGEVAVFIVDPEEPSKKQTFTGTIDTANVQVTDVVWTAGTNQAHSGGATVVDYASATHISMMTKGILVEHDQAGQHSKALKDENGNEWLEPTATASAVNHVKITNAAASGRPKIEATGSDTNIGLEIVPKGTGMVVISDTPARLGAIHRYTFDGTDIHVDGVDQNNGGNTISWTKPANLKFVIVEVVGGGGGGGGAASSAASNAAQGGGGGAGGYSRKKIAAASLGSTETVTVGAAGTGATAGANNGGAGGNSSFGAHATANGGSGGSGMVAETGDRVSPGGAGGSAASGDINITGESGTFGRVSSAWPNQDGAGGNSPYGSCGRNRTGAAGAGAAASGYGAGGGGGLDQNGSSTNRAGGAGAGGIVIVYEYY